MAVLRVALEYLSNLMYNQIRGPGLTYSISMSGSVTEGRLQVKFSRSSQLEQAYKVFRDIIAEYSSKGNVDKWENVLLDSAKGSVIYDWTEREETVENLASTSIKVNIYSVLKYTKNTM